MKPSTKKSPSKWNFGRWSAIGKLMYRQCKGAISRRVPTHNLTFLGVADIAGLLWCEIQATISQIEIQAGYVLAAWEDDHHNGEAVIKKNRRSRLSPKDVSTSLSKDRLAEGLRAQERCAQNHGSKRRHWDFGEFFVIGVPDGVAKDFVYEFKFSKYPKSDYTFKNAMAQANIYGTLFGKKHLRIHLAGSDGYEKVANGDVRSEDAYDLIHKAWRLMNGEDKFRLPESWKCKPCKYRQKCPVPTESRIPSIKGIRELFSEDGPSTS